jgi:hypothetical protein
MRYAIVFPALILAAAAFAQDSSRPAPEPGPKSVTVPVRLDHNRVVVDVDIRLPDGATARIRGWVDNGDPELYLSRRVAGLMGLGVTCNDKECSASPPRDVVIGGMSISLAEVKQATIPLKPVAEAASLVPGTPVEINIPSTVLRQYDVLIDFPDRKLTLAQPGSLKFLGVRNKMLVNAADGLIEIPSEIANKKYNLGLDVGSPISFLAEDLFARLAATHAGWPQMSGAIGPANLGEGVDETKWKLMRVDRLHFGPLYLTGVPFMSLEEQAGAVPQEHEVPPAAGVLGSEALLNYRIGLDYAHSTVYFDIGRLFNFPDFDVVGLILRPEGDGRFTILGIADYDGEPSLPEGQSGIQAGDHLIAVDGIPVSGSSLGQVWSMLGGSPGKERKLTIERRGEQSTVVARVRHFLGEAEENQKGESGKR